jgi:hypothetical protein
MARNVYISNGVKSEQDLYEDLIIESMQIYGTDVWYLPRSYYSIDTILNEDTLSKFDSSFKIEMYIESIDGLEGDGKLYSKFGFEIRDQITFVVSRRRWNQLIGNKGFTKESVRPREGDLIYIPMTKGLFEIRYVEDKKPFFQVKNVPTFKLTCENFEYSNQEINTGIAEVDKIQRTSSTVINVEVEFEAEELHNINEKLIVALPSGVTGYTKLLEYKKNDIGTIIERLATLNFDDGQFHKLTVGTTLTGEDSGFVSTITSLYELDDTNEFAYNNDPHAQNTPFENQGNLIIDFSESNPFGEPNDA